jgi:hypothetical protein
MADLTDAEAAALWRSLREPVRLFALAMEAKLKKNDHKDGWDNCTTGSLLRRMGIEVRELSTAVHRFKDVEASGSVSEAVAVERVVGEAADVANFAMMVADVCGGLEANRG